MASKEVLLLFSYETYPSGARKYIHHADILNRVQGADHALQFHFGAMHDFIFVYDGSELRVTDPKTGRDVTDFDLVFFQKWMDLPQHSLAIALYLASKQAPFMSSEVLRQNPISKLAELPMLAAAHLPIPKTVVAPLSTIKGMIDKGTLPFALPCIVKDVRGSQGSNNFLIHDVEELLVIEKQLPESTFMAQEFIENDCDYRIAIMGGEVQYVLKRTRKGSTHLNNTSQGGEGEFVPNDYLPAHVLADAIAAAKALGREEFAGVDMIIDPQGKHWVLEVNKSPEIQTGYDFAHKSRILVNYLAKRLG